MSNMATVIEPGSFKPSRYFSKTALNSTRHPTVDQFFTLTHEQIIERYALLNPAISKRVLKSILTKPTKYFHWAGCDLFHASTLEGRRKMVLLETNSASYYHASSTKSQQYSTEYRTFEGFFLNGFLPLVKSNALPRGSLAVISSEIHSKTIALAQVLAGIIKKPVYLIPMNESSKGFTYSDGVLVALLADGRKVKIKAAINLAMENPWKYIPIKSKTLFYNPLITNLAGGRNKLIAHKAYLEFNNEIRHSELAINIPHTITDLTKDDIPHWVELFEGHAVVKAPYSNNGNNIFTICNDKELEHFMKQDFEYDHFIIQDMIGHPDWCSRIHKNRYYCIGTIPNKQKQSYVYHLRCMCLSSHEGIFPNFLHAIRTPTPLQSKVDRTHPSWNMLGTNTPTTTANHDRSITCSTEDFDQLGLGIDDLIAAYIQTAMAMQAIDRMSKKLLNPNGSLKKKLFYHFNHEDKLLDEMI